MAILIHPKRWTTQPPQGAQINFGHPLAKGLTFYIPFIAGAGIQKALLPPGLPGTSLGSVPAPNWISGPDSGKSQNWNGAWSAWYERGLWVEPPTNLSLVFRARRTGTVVNNAVPLYKTYQNNTTPFLSYAIDYNDGGAGQDVVNAYIQTAGVLHNGGQLNLGAGATLNPHTLAMSYTSGSLKLYFNGINKQTTTTITGAPSYDQTSTGRMILSGVSAISAIQEFIGQLYYAGVWNRVLTASEMEWLHAEPYAMFVPTKPRMRAILVKDTRPIGAAVIHPKRWTSQPPVGARIDFGHPLAQGLSALVLFNENAGVPKNLIPNNNPAENNAPLWGTSQLGGFIKKVTNTTSPAWVFTDSTRITRLDRATILFRRRFTDTTLRTAGTFGVEDPSSTFTLRCGANAPYSDGIIYWDFGGVSAPNRLTWNGYTKGTSPEQWAFRAGQLGSSIWFNKHKVASQSTAITRVSSSNNFDVGSGNGPVSQLSDLAEWSFFALYKTELPDSLIQWWMDEPYAMMTPTGRRRYVLGTGIPAVVTNRQPNICVAIF